MANKKPLSGYIPATGGNCHFCNQPVSQDHFCFGCGVYVCEACDIGKPIGFHTPEEHTEPDSEDVDNETI